MVVLVYGDNVQIVSVGSALMWMLGRLKHMGAVSEAHLALQTVCEVLLQHGEKHAGLCQMPRVWLTDLLGRLAGDQQSFVLRRSAGFAFSYLSILRSEPRNCIPTLLPLAMETLLRTARGGLRCAELSESDGPKNSWRACVHALNILKFILLDAALANDVLPYVAEAAMIAVLGFQDPNWAVRNSSMMVFSAVMQRAVDNKKNASDLTLTSTSKGATPLEFFGRFPDLYPFLLNQLAAATGHRVVVEEATGQPSGTEVASGGHDLEVMHPSLYPLMLLLSRLRNSSLPDFAVGENLADEEPLAQSAQLASTRQPNMKLFAPLIRSCASQRFHKIRTVASWALAAITPLEDIQEECELLFSSLDTLQCNEQHGVLLQVQSLLDTFARNTWSAGGLAGNASQVTHSLVKALAAQLAQRKELLDPSFLQFRPPLASVLLDVMYLLSGCATVSNFVEVSLLEDLQHACEAILHNLLSALRQRQVMVGEPLLIMRCLRYLSLSATPNLDLLFACLSHPTLELRCGALESLREILGMSRADITGALDWIVALPARYTIHAAVDRERVMASLSERVGHEQHPPLLACLLATTTELSAGAPIIDNREHFVRLAEKWDYLAACATAEDDVYNTDVAASAIELLGHLVRWFSEDHFVQWLNVIERASGAHHPAFIREAAVRSVSHSKILHDKSTSARLWMAVLQLIQVTPITSRVRSCQPLIVIFVCVLMRQDDDENVRVLVNQVVSAVLSRQEQVACEVEGSLLQHLPPLITDSLVSAIAAGDYGALDFIKSYMEEACAAEVLAAEAASIDELDITRKVILPPSCTCCN